MARKPREEDSGDSWLNTYSDMVTLLLTFFIMLFSMSSVAEDKWQALVKAFAQTGEDTNQVVLTPEGAGDQIGDNHGVPPEGIATPTGEADAANDLPIDFQELYEYLKKYVSDNGMEGSVSVEKGKDQSVFIRFQNSVLFNADSHTLLPGGKEMLDFLAAGLINIEDQIQAININGHAANIPGYPVSDRMVSAQRASSVAMYLEDNAGVDRSIILAIGNGNSHPIADNDTAEGRKQNRRVDMLIVGKESILTSGSEILNALQGTYDPTIYPKTGTGEEFLFPDDPNRDPSELIGSIGDDAAEASTTTDTTTTEPAPDAATPPPADATPDAAAPAADAAADSATNPPNA